MSRRAPSGTPGRPPRLLAFGTYDREQHPRVGVLIDGMRERGWDVAELDRPLGLSTAERVRILRRPWLLPVLALRLLARWSALVLGSVALRGPRRPDAVLVGYLGHFDVLLARVLFPRTPIVLDHLIFAAGTARDRGERGGVKLRLLELLDAAATGAADVIVVDTDEHAALLAPERAARAVVVPVGATDSWFRASTREDDRGSAGGPLSIVFYGLFTPLQGAPAIARALRRVHDLGVPFRATLIGSGQDHEECQSVLDGVSQVTWVPWVPAEELPDLVAGHDVCIGILGTTPKAENVVPNKVYQGLAAGCAVVTSGTAPQRRILGDAVVMVSPGDDEELARTLVRLANNPAYRRSARQAARDARSKFRPAAVVAPLDDHLRSQGGRR